MQEFSFQIFEAFAAATVIYLAHQPGRGAGHALRSRASVRVPGPHRRGRRAAGGTLTGRLRLGRHPALAPLPVPGRA